MARGLRTLFYYRTLLNPFAHGVFAFMLASHKLLRWLPYLLAPTAYIALCVLALTNMPARVMLAVATTALLAGIVELRRANAGSSRPLAMAGFVIAAISAGFLAWWAAFRQSSLAIWEPTPRPGLRASGS